MPKFDDLPLDAPHAMRSATINLRHEFDGMFNLRTIEQFLATSYDQSTAADRWPVPSVGVRPGGAGCRAPACLAL